MWLKCYYPAQFYCALLNQQPMGFYSSEVIIGDAERHGVTLLPPDVNRSEWRFTVETTAEGVPALRTGLCKVKEVGQQVWQPIETARTRQSFADLRDFCRRTRVSKEVTANLIRSGALDAFGSRRQLLWELGGLDYRPSEFDLSVPPADVELPALEPLEQTLWDYELLGLSPDGQIMQHYRAALRRAGVLSTWQVKHEAKGGQRVRVAGMVVVRQRPQTAKGILFISLEDESGLLDLVVKPKVYPRVRSVLQTTMLIVADGIVQRGDDAVSVLVGNLNPLGGS
jgi:error-prone DNA polymerase